MNKKITHVPLELGSRLLKAKKIELLLKTYNELKYGKFLEVGCGSGYITQYFSDIGFGTDNTFGVDVEDNRQVSEGFNFTEISDTQLPFDDNQFDLVVSNHVIEHVGDHDSQQNHLNEIFRVLKPEGVLYFAVPNKWFPLEPHYKLLFLSWLNRPLASNYIKLLNRGFEYDCELLSKKTCEVLLTNSGFKFQNVSATAITAYATVEGGLLARALAALPISLLKILNPLVPTFIYVCRKT